MALVSLLARHSCLGRKTAIFVGDQDQMHSPSWACRSWRCLLLPSAPGYQPPSLANIRADPSAGPGPGPLPVRSRHAAPEAPS